MKRRFRSSVYRWGVLLVLVMLGMLGTLNGVAVAADADTIVMALELDQDTMDPHMHFQRVGILMNINMYDSLLHKTTKLEYEPSLATEWQALDDTTWEFKLRQGVKFHNGDPFSAEDVKFSFDRVLDPNTKSPQYGNIRAIKEVKIIDPHTVHLITDKPFPLLLERVVFFPIIPKKHFEKVGAQAFADNAPVGTGPYKFVEWKRDQYLKMERFERALAWTGTDQEPSSSGSFPRRPRRSPSSRRVASISCVTSPRILSPISRPTPTPMSPPPRSCARTM